jgi:hypothetical protein
MVKNLFLFISFLFILLFLTMISCNRCTPDQPVNSVFRIEYETSTGHYIGPGDSVGTAFACKVKEDYPPILLTAHHLFVDIDSDSNYRSCSWSELDSSITHVILTSITDTLFRITADENIPIPGAESMSATRFNRDIAAFKISNNKGIGALQLSRYIPEIGDTVRLYAKLNGANNNKNIIHDANVDVLNDSLFMYSFLDTCLTPQNLPHTSGAPILNLNGEVVGINVGGGTFDLEAIDWMKKNLPKINCNWKIGEIVGMGVPLHSIKKLLNDAIHQ